MLISSTLLSRPSCRPDSFVIPFRSPLCLVARSIRRNCPPVKSTGERQLTAITKVEFCHILSVFQIWTFSLYFSSKLEVEFSISKQKHNTTTSKTLFWPMRQTRWLTCNPQSADLVISGFSTLQPTKWKLQNQCVNTLTKTRFVHSTTGGLEDLVIQMISRPRSNSPSDSAKSCPGTAHFQRFARGSLVVMGIVIFVLTNHYPENNPVKNVVRTDVDNCSSCQKVT